MRYLFPHLVELCSSHFVEVSILWVFNLGQGSFSFMLCFNHCLNYCHYSSILLERLCPHVPGQHPFGLGFEVIVSCPLHILISFCLGKFFWQYCDAKNALSENSTFFHALHASVTLIFQQFLEFWPLSSSVPFYPKVAEDGNPVFSSPLTASFLSCTHCLLSLWGCCRIPVVAVSRSEAVDDRVIGVRTTTAFGAQVMFSDSLLKIVVACFRRRSWIRLTPSRYLCTICIKMLGLN